MRSFLSTVGIALAALVSAPAWSTDISTDTVILVAKRVLQDRLYGSTILVAKPVGADRHVGFIVNKPTTTTLGKLFPNHPPSQKIVDPVYLGGPASSSVIFAMVSRQDSPGGRALKLAPGLYLSFESNEVDAIIEKQPSQARFFAGMVVWTPGELADEVKRGLWYVLDAQPDVVLRKSTDGLWEDLVNRAERKANTI
jgi:putative transcriptional regulator